MVLYDQGLQKFYNSSDIQNIIKTNRPLVFDKTKDMELRNNLTSVISDGEVFTQRNENLVVTGFDFEDTKQEATDSIKSVNALYGYTPEFLEIYAQVGVAYASLSNNINYNNSLVNEMYKCFQYNELKRKRAA